MTALTKTHANVGVRTLIGMTIVAAALLAGGPDRAWAQSSAGKSAPAPIVYAKASPNSPVTFNQFQGRPQSDAAIDLRPGALKTSFGTTAPVSRLEPKAEQPIASAVPYAGPPYQVDGKWYVPAYEPNYNEVGIASWYGPTFHGKDSASGEVFDENAMTAAHPTLPIPSLVRVTNLENGKSVIVRLNDRGPFVDDRIIDLSRKAGAELGMQAKGTARVRVQYVGPAPAAPNAVPAQPSPVAVASTPAPMAPPVIAEEAPLVPPQVAMQPASEPTPDLVSKPLAPIAQPIRSEVARAADAGRGYFLQAGSFADLGNAHALRNRLGAFGPVSVVSANVNGAEFYRVMVGPWATRPEAETAQARLVDNGAKALIVAKLD